MRACVRACLRAYLRAYLRACGRACVFVHLFEKHLIQSWNEDEDFEGFIHKELEITKILFTYAGSRLLSAMSVRLSVCQSVRFFGLSVG